MEEWKSLVRVEFCIEGKNIEVNEITDLLKIRPKLKFNRNDENISSPIAKKVGRWEIGTEYEISSDVKDQLSKIIKKLFNKKEELKKIKKKWKCDFVFSVDIDVYNGRFPAVTLNKKEIDFFHEIDAIYVVDIYRFTED